LSVHQRRVRSGSSKIVQGSLSFQVYHPSSLTDTLRSLAPSSHRCMRHFAIYAQPWPSRIPDHVNASLPTPRDGTPVEGPTKRVTDKGLSTLDRKLAVAASASSKSRHQDIARSPKKRGTEPREMSNAARRTFSGSRTDGEPPKRKRGRPRLSSPRRVVKEVKDEEGDKLKSLTLQNQPRDSSGRFGKKGYSGRRQRFTVGIVLSRAQRAIARGQNKSRLERKAEGCENQENNGISDLSGRKRGALDLDDPGRPNKKSRVGDESIPHPWFTATKSPLGLKSMGLLRAPNPMTFARRAWLPSPDVSPSSKVGVDATATILEDETDLPITPDDRFTSSAVVVDSDGESGPVEVSKRRSARLPDGDGNGSISSPAFRQAAAHRLGPLTSNPSPFNFARRRWASASTSPDRKHDACCKNNSKCRNSLPEPKRAAIVEGEKAPDVKTGTFAASNEKPPVDSWSKDNDPASSDEEVGISLRFLPVMSATNVSLHLVGRDHSWAP
jgi:[histone H4]-N-methyl-L-lysine20 N-methyltransferase